MALFRNFYRCDKCGHEWTDVWSATCDDDCPHCGARHMSPYKSEDAPPPSDGDGGVHVQER
jgi:predicted  nucleic acid-binding Zn-ribbon protein